MACLKYQCLSREAKQQAEKLREQLQASEAHVTKLKQENMVLQAQLREDLSQNEPGFSGQPDGKQSWPRLLLRLCILLLATLCQCKSRAMLLVLSGMLQRACIH